MLIYHTMKSPDSGLARASRPIQGRRSLHALNVPTVNRSCHDDTADSIATRQATIMTSLMGYEIALKQQPMCSNEKGTFPQFMLIQQSSKLEFFIILCL